jgi:pyridoxal 5'-phosphate synthase pdxS subunit
MSLSLRYYLNRIHETLIVQMQNVDQHDFVEFKSNIIHTPTHYLYNTHIHPSFNTSSIEPTYSSGHPQRHPLSTTKKIITYTHTYSTHTTTTTTVIMDVMNPQQAKVAEDAGAVAVMALERIPADIRADGGVSRMSDPKMIKSIQDAVTIPVMAKARIGHFVEAQILEALEIDYIDESEVLTMADDENHIDKTKFTVPFVCGCRNLGEALRRIAEGAAMLRTKGEAGTGNIVEAVRHARAVNKEINKVKTMDDTEIFTYAKQIGAPVSLVQKVKELGRLPVVNFAAGGVATPADAALMMQLGMDGVFVGSGIFKSGDPKKRARAIVQAVTHYKDAQKLVEVSTDIGKAMVGISDIKRSHVNFRDREGGAMKKRKVEHQNGPGPYGTW